MISMLNHNVTTKTSEDRSSIERLQASILIRLCLNVDQHDNGEVDDDQHDNGDDDENLPNDVPDLPHGEHRRPPRTRRERDDQRLCTVFALAGALTVMLPYVTNYWFTALPKICSLTRPSPTSQCHNSHSGL